MLIGERVFTGKASPPGGLADITVARASVQGFEIIRRVIFVACFQAAGEDGEHIGIVKRHVVPF